MSERMTISRFNTAFWFGIHDLSETAVRYPSRDAGRRIRETLRDVPRKQRREVARWFRQAIGDDLRDKRLERAVEEQLTSDRVRA